MTKLKSILLFAAIAGAIVPVHAFGTTVIVPALKDTMIFGTQADGTPSGHDTGKASGNGPAFFAGADGSSNRKRSLIEFDIASANIPFNATIQSVTMTLYLGQVAGSGGPNGGGSYPSRSIGLYEVLQPWGEGSSGLPTSKLANGGGQGYTAKLGDSTWDYAYYDPTGATSQLWNGPGGEVYGGSFNPAASADPAFTVFSTLNAPFNWSTPGMTSDVQDWVSGHTTNNGWLMKSDLEDSPTSFLGFWSKEGAAANNDPTVAGAPALSITYIIPEPASLSLIGGGLALLLMRRRK